VVTQAQLGEAQGWVRCGVCHEVFIAQAHTAKPPQTLVMEAPLPQREEVLPDDEPHLYDELAAAATATPSKTALPSQPQAQRVPPTRPSRSAAPKPVNAHSGPGRALIGALLVLLALQVGFQGRNALAEAFPESASWLQSLCPKGRCGLRLNNALSIEDANFTTTGPKLFHLSATVANRSALVLEAPLLALTLTDAADHTIARKVYPPQDWSATSSTVPGGTRAAATLWIQWDEASSQQRVAGYRLQAFYPE
jgi:hypothetical protein